MVVEEPEGESEHVLEVQPTHRSLAALVPVVDPQHQLRGDRRLVAAEIMAAIYRAILLISFVGSRVPLRRRLDQLIKSSAAGLHIPPLRR